MIDVRDISYTEGDPLTPVVSGKLIKTPSPIDVYPAGAVVSVVETPVQPDLLANILDVAKYGPFGLGGPILATVEHALGKEPTLVSTGFGAAASGYGLLGAGAYMGETLPAVVEKGIIGPTAETTVQPEQIKHVIEHAPFVSVLEGKISIDPFDFGGLSEGLFGGIKEILKGALPWLLLIGAGYMMVRSER